MNKKFVLGLGMTVLIFVVAIFAFKNPGVKRQEKIACTQEAKICPNGSSIGRTGPNCEFAECPVVAPTKEAAVKKTEPTVASLKQKISSNGISIEPLEVTEDSRCAVGVLCAWAGTVGVSAEFGNGGETQTVALRIGSPVTFAGKQITLMGVTPPPYAGKIIKSGEYRFQFLVENIPPANGGVNSSTLETGIK